MHCKNFLKVHKNTGEEMFAKHLSADDCFVKTILLTVMITTMLSVSGYQGVSFYQVAHETKFHLKYQSDPSAQQHGLSIQTKVLICKKTEDEPAYCPDRNGLLEIIETMQKFFLFSNDSAIVYSQENHVARIIDQRFAEKSRHTTSRDYIPIRDYQRLQFAKKCF